MESCSSETAPRLHEAFLQLTNESIIFERLMYKNVNQHRRALYFRRLCQVRRDLRLLQSTKLTQLIQNVLQFSEKSLRKPSYEQDRHQAKDMRSETSHLRRRLYGVVRLLDQMYDPISNAGLQVAGLLGLTFFMPFALTTFSMLARIRALVLQCLQDITIIYNSFSEWASERELIDHNFQALPISLTCEWDDTKLSIVPVMTQPRCESDDKEFVQDQHGRKYIVLQSLPLGAASSGLLSDDLEAAEAAPIDDLIQQAVQPPALLSGMNNTPMVGPGLSMLTVEETKNDSHSMEQSEVQSSKMEGSSITLNLPRSPLLENQVFSTCGVTSNPLCENGPKARDDAAPVPKKVAYVSVLSPSNFEPEKEEETPPLKKAKQDCLFDLLLGLQDDSHRSLF